MKSDILFTHFENCNLQVCVLLSYRSSSKNMIDVSKYPGLDALLTPGRW